MTDQQPQTTGSQEAGPDLAKMRLTELSLEELESEITQAQALVQDLNERLKLTAEDSR